MESHTIAMHSGGVESAYRRYRLAVFNYLRRCGAPREAAEELMQSTFIVLLEKPHRYDSNRGPLLPFLIGVARTLRLAWLRRATLEATDRATAAPSMDESTGTIADVRAAVLELPDEFRESLVLREFHGFTYQEIADLQGIPVGTVRSRLARARDLLRVRLKGE
jgi:RNA polymerase sigma-70 factor (ECF subfamily)